MVETAMVEATRKRQKFTLYFTSGHHEVMNCVVKLIGSQPALSNWSAEHGGTDCCM